MLSPEQCRAARGWLNWTQEDLAAKANVSLSTVRDFEKERRVPIANNLEAMERVLEANGIKLHSGRQRTFGIEARPRISERSILIPTLDFLDQSPDGFVATSDLIGALELMFEPEGEDAAILENRADTKFSQIVRNMVSHQKSSTNIIGAGYAIYDERRHGLIITDKGRKFLLKNS